MSFSLIDNKSKQNYQYQPDLDDLLSQCELNYWLLVQLLPRADQLSDYFCLKAHEESAVGSKMTSWIYGAESVTLTFNLQDVAKYTTTFNLEIKMRHVEVARNVNLIVRLYHDAQMLEVMEGSGPSAMQAIYESKHVSKAADEKRQVNRFVGECLRACFEMKKTNNAEYKEL